MIKKLRIKFVAIAITSVFLLLSLILITVNTINYSMVARNADEITQILLDKGGTFFDGNAPIDPNAANNGESQSSSTTDNSSTSTNPPIGPIPPTIPGERGGDRKEAAYDTRYFYVKYDKDGNVVEVNTNNTVTYTQDEALALASQKLSKKVKTGWDGNYRYRVGIHEDYTYVIYVDFARELDPSRTVTYTSLIIGGIGLIIAFVIIYFISNLIVKPVDEAFKKQKHFISNASHELKTPITVISANSEILEIEYGNNESIDTINRQVRKLAELVKDLNNLAKIDEYDKLSVFNKFDLSSATREVVEPFEELFKKDNKELEILIEPNIEMKGDETLIRTLINTIIENSYKYSISKASFTLKKEGDRIIIEARNNAELVKEGDLDEVFERFYRSDEVRASGIDGSGIGLSIAKEIVNLHKGRIKAHSENDDFIIRAEL